MSEKFTSKIYLKNLELRVNRTYSTLGPSQPKRGRARKREKDKESIRTNNVREGVLGVSVSDYV